MAGIAISSFLSQAVSQSGHPRTTNLWQLEMNLADNQAVTKFFENNKLTMYARDFKLPQLGIDYKQLYFRGVPIPVPVNPTITQQLSFNMYADVTGDNEQNLRQWMNQVIDMDFQSGSYLGGQRSINPSNTLRLQLLSDDMETVTQTVTLVGVSIETIGEIQFVQTAGDIATFPLTVQFAWPSYDFSS